MNILSWKNDSLERLFNPKSIAVVGASDKPNKLGALSLLALQSYKGTIIPVNPRLEYVHGHQCYQTVESFGSPIDLAIIAVGPQQVISALEDCAAARVGGAVIFSAGFKELGGEGVEHQNIMRNLVDKAHIAVIGPNCLGAGNPNIDLNATFFPHPVPLRRGSVAMISQSGGVTGLMLYRAADIGLGVSKFASIGNRVNIDFHDMVRYLRNDSQTRVICLFIEGTEHGREMMNEITRTTSKKPVIAFKVGKTPASREAALSHTGSLAGVTELYSAAIKQSGGVEVSGVEDMIDLAYLLSTLRCFPKGNRVAIVTHTLGIALIVAQTLEENGILLPLPSESVARTIEKSLDLPVEIVIKNPIDLLATGWANPKIFANAFNLILHEDKYDAAVIVFSPNYQENIGGGLPVEEIVRIAADVEKPVVSVLTSPDSRKPPGYDVLEAGGIPFYSSPQRAAKALANAIKLSRNQKF
jgi:acyl-CoA synthetase (NDP forming)